MSKAPPTPDEHMAALKHPLRDAVQSLRTMVMAADKRFEESIKWNSFNYSIGGADRVTFNARGADRVLVIFHAGAKKKPVDLRSKVADPAGLLEWPSKDRAIAAFVSVDEIKKQRAPITKLVKAWVAATEGL